MYKQHTYTDIQINTDRTSISFKTKYYKNRNTIQKGKNLSHIIYKELLTFQSARWPWFLVLCPFYSKLAGNVQWKIWRRGTLVMNSSEVHSGIKRTKKKTAYLEMGQTSSTQCHISSNWLHFAEYHQTQKWPLWGVHY